MTKTNSLRKCSVRWLTIMLLYSSSNMSRNISSPYRKRNIPEKWRYKRGTKTNKSKTKQIKAKLNSTVSLGKTNIAWKQCTLCCKIQIMLNGWETKKNNKLLWPLQLINQFTCLSAKEDDHCIRITFINDNSWFNVKVKLKLKLKFFWNFFFFF